MAPNTLITSIAVSLIATAAMADRTELPEAYLAHGLVEDAKREFIAIAFDEGASAAEQSQSLASLAEIAFDEGNITVALDTWKKLVTIFPTSEAAAQVADRIDQIAQITEQSTDQAFDNVVARSYIRHGDWWSRGKEERVTIDTSWIPKDDVAISWYDRVVEEFPDSDAAVAALKKKFYTIYGWKDPGQYGGAYGIQGGKKVEDLVTVFEDLTAASPDDPDLQRFRYMIAQAFWVKRAFSETKDWLAKIIEADEGQDGFYKDLAEWRMKKVEY